MSNIKLKPLMTSNSNEWYTPHYLFKRLDDEFNFTLDPCCTKESAKCDLYYTKDDDGLSKDWAGESVFVNPPYGREIKDWVKKSYMNGIKKDTTVVMLIPARTDTSYWHNYIFNKAYKIIFISGRIKFEFIDNKSINSAPFPSAIVVFKIKTLNEDTIIQTMPLNKLDRSKR